MAITGWMARNFSLFRILGWGCGRISRGFNKA
jgi:hypothetical protein